MKKTILIKILNNEIWIFKNNELLIEKTQTIINNNFITNYETLTKSLKKIINKHKILNNIIQNNIYIIINKLYCETNLFIIKHVMYNLGIVNYKLIYEEDIYKEYNKSILSYWKDCGIYIDNEKEIYIDYKTNLNDLLKENTLVITADKDIITRINKKILIYENTICTIFSILSNKKK